MNLNIYKINLNSITNGAFYHYKIIGLVTLLILIIVILCHVLPLAVGGSTELHVMFAAPQDTEEEEEGKGGLQQYCTSSQVILAVTKNHFPSFEITDVRLVWNKDPLM